MKTNTNKTAAALQRQCKVTMVTYSLCDIYYIANIIIDSICLYWAIDLLYNMYDH